MAALLLSGSFGCSQASSPSLVMPSLQVSAKAPNPPVKRKLSAFVAVQRTLKVITEDIVSQIEAEEALKTDVALINANTGERTVVTIGFDGSVNEETQKQINAFFRCRRTNRKHNINQGLLAKLADLSRRFDGRAIDIVSGYRSAPHSTPTSRHRHGRAADIRIVGISSKKIRDYLWMRHGDEVGVGYYKQQQFVHLDHRPGHKPTAWTQHREDADYQYRPQWSRKLDRAKKKSHLKSI